MDTYCALTGQVVDNIRFFTPEGARVQHYDTAESLGLDDGDLYVYEEQRGGNGHGDAADSPPSENLEQPDEATQESPDDVDGANPADADEDDLYTASPPRRKTTTTVGQASKGKREAGSERKAPAAKKQKLDPAVSTSSKQDAGKDSFFTTPWD